jgi:AmpE protein
MKLLAILIAFGVFHWLGKPKILQSFVWWQTILDFGEKQAWFKTKWLKVLILLLIPVLLLALIAQLLTQQHDHQLWYLLFNSAVLYYCLGPEQLEIEAKQMQAEQPETEDSLQWLVNKLTDESIKRWFLVVFWFVVLGAAGALMCRLLAHFIQQKQTTQDSLMNRLYDVLSYPVIWLMIISLLVASDFDRIWHHCKRYLKRQDWYLQQRSLLYEAMDFAVENCEIEDFKSDDPETVRDTTLSVLKRILMVWLVLVAFSVIFTIG